MRRRLKVFIFCSAVLGAVAVAGQNGDRIEFSAESTTTEFIEGGVIKRYSGDVAARSQDLLLRAEEAVYNSVRNEIRLYGDAMLQDSVRTLYADTLVYYDRRREALASGDVRGIEKARSFRAGQVRYLRDEHILHGSGGVTVRDDSIRSSLTGMALTFNDSTRNGWVVGMPSLVREDDDGSIITITAQDTIRIAREARTAELWNSVEVKKDSMTARSERALYEDIPEKVTLFGEPVIEYIMHGTGDEDDIPLRIVSEVTGDTVFVYLEERKLAAVEVAGNAVGTTVALDSTGAVYYRSVLESRSMRLDMTEDQVTGVVARGSARSYYMHAATISGREQFVNSAKGDTIRFFFDDGSITNMRIRGGSSGEASGKYLEYKPVRPDSVKSGEDEARR